MSKGGYVVLVTGLMLGLNLVQAQVPSGGDLTYGSQDERGGGQYSAPSPPGAMPGPPGGPAVPWMGPPGTGFPGQTQGQGSSEDIDFWQALSESLATGKTGALPKGPSRVYDAVDGRMIRNEVLVAPYNLSRNEAERLYDNGKNGDEVANDGVPANVVINDTDYIGPRTAAIYDWLKGLLFAIASHPDGPQRFFDLPLVSLDWDGPEADWNPEEKTGYGVFRLTSLERRMFAFVMQDSLDIMRAFQRSDGKDLIPQEDKVAPPSEGQMEWFYEEPTDTWNQALATGQKVLVERKMIAALADTEIADASWFPGQISAVQLSRYRSGFGGALSTMGIGDTAGGLPGGMGMMPGAQMGAFSGGMPGMGGMMGGMPGMGGMGGGYGGMGGIQSFTPAAGAIGVGAF